MNYQAWIYAWTKQQSGMHGGEDRSRDLDTALQLEKRADDVYLAILTRGETTDR